jgi:hypothetical protein
MNKYKVNIRKIGDKKWEEFTGSFSEKKGYTIEKVKDHMVEFFSSPQYSCYEFSIFQKRLGIKTIKYDYLYVLDLPTITPFSNLN